MSKKEDQYDCQPNELKTKCPEFLKYRVEIAMLYNPSIAAFLSNLIHQQQQFREFCKQHDGWFWRTATDVYYDTGINRGAQDRYIKRLTEDGLIDFIPGDENNVRWFRINYHIFFKTIKPVRAKILKRRRTRKRMHVKRNAMARNTNY